METYRYITEEQQKYINTELLVLKEELEVLSDKLIKQKNFYAAGYIQQEIAKLEIELAKESEK